MTAEPQELVVLSQASQALASVHTIDQAKELRDKAEAVKAYARKAKLGREILVSASVVRARAERRLGEILQETDLANSSPGNQHTGPMERLEDAGCTLESLGLTKSDSSRLQRLASMPSGVFEEHVALASEQEREVTMAGLLRLAKQYEPIEAAGFTNGNSPARSCNSLSQLVELGETFSTIYADPPWPDNNQATRGATSNRYPTMSIDAICDEPISQLAAADAHLHLWTTSTFLLEAFDVLEAWGFQYKSCFVWIKPQMGAGDYWRLSHEFLLFGIRGSLKFTDRGQKSWLSAKRAQHSRKPEAVRQLIELVSPPRYLEMYGRRLPLNPDWTVYGNQLQ